MATQRQNPARLVLLAFSIQLLWSLPTSWAFAGRHTTRRPTSLTRQSATTGPGIGSVRTSSSSLHYRNRESHVDQTTRIHEDLLIQAPPTNSDSKQQKTALVTGGVNLPLLQRLCKSQAILLLGATVLAAVCSGGDFLSSLQWGNVHEPLSPLSIRLATGVLATLPMIGVSHLLVETSNHRDAHYVQFATTHMVMTLFGRRQNLASNAGNGQITKPSNPNSASQTLPAGSTTLASTTTTTTPTTSTATVLLFSLGLTLATAVSEELVFRGFLPTALWNLSNANLVVACFGQAILFGLGHFHPNSKEGENRLVVELQSLNGLWHGLVYLLTGGDLLPCIVSHLLYDWHVFVETWHRVNKQMDWTQQHLHDDWPEQEKAALEQLQNETQVSKETLDFLVNFFLAFDRTHQMSLSLEDVSCAVSYAFWKDNIVPDQAQVEQVFEQLVESSSNDKRLGFANFARLLLILRRQTLQSQKEPRVIATSTN